MPHVNTLSIFSIFFSNNDPNPVCALHFDEDVRTDSHKFNVINGLVLTPVPVAAPGDGNEQIMARCDGFEAKLAVYDAEIGWRNARPWAVGWIIVNFPARSGRE